jgi:molybdopterin-guanine dinucleotide biosynthesis protein A
MTDAERRLWHQLKAHRLESLHFRRQVPLGPYIADFVCHARKLIIEVDGGQHNDAEGIDRDARRTAWLESVGYRVLRFGNIDVLTNMEGVIDAITATAGESSRARTTPLPPSPWAGEGDWGKPRVPSPPILSTRTKKGAGAPHELPVGCILAGGQSRRMGGNDKALIELAGKSLLDRIVIRIAPQLKSLILNANGDRSRFAACGLPVIADGIAGFAGPLAGILAGLEWAAAQDARWMVSVAIDTPFLPLDLTSRLAEANRGNEIACAASGGRTHPVIGRWPTGLAAELRHALTVENVHKVDAWTARHRVGIAEWPNHPYDPFFNINRPPDLVEAERILSEYSP